MCGFAICFMQFEGYTARATARVAPTVNIICYWL